MVELKDDAKLLQALQASAKRPLSEGEIRKQKISFVMGMVGAKSHVTRAKVKEVLAKHEGRKISA